MSKGAWELGALAAFVAPIGVGLSAALTGGFLAGAALDKTKTAAAPPAPVATPPPTQDNAASIAQMQYLYAQQMNRRSMQSTIYAGSTGGWSPAAPSVKS